MNADTRTDFPWVQPARAPRALGCPSPDQPSRPASTIMRWIERSRQRRALASLGDDLLDDIGLTRAKAEKEAAKPFWR